MGFESLYLIYIDFSSSLKLDEEPWRNMEKLQRTNRTMVTGVTKSKDQKDGEKIRKINFGNLMSSPASSVSLPHQLIFKFLKYYLFWAKRAF